MSEAEERALKLHKGKPPKYCPKCSRKGKVYNTRQRDAFVWRRHRCKQSHRWTSCEVLVDHPNEMSSSRDSVMAEMRRETIEELITTLKGMK